MDWFDIMVEEGVKRSQSSESPMMKEYGPIAMKILIDHKSDFMVVGKEFTQKMIGNVALGNVDKARELYIQKIAGADELISGVESSGEAMIDSNRNYLDAQRRADSIIRRVAGEISRILFPLIFGSF